MDIGIVYNAPLGGRAIGRVEGDALYGSQYGYDQIGRVEDGYVYDSPHRFRAIGRVDRDGTVHDSHYGYSPVGRVEGDGWIYDQQFRPLGRVDGGRTPDREAIELSGAALRLLLKRDAEVAT